MVAGEGGVCLYVGLEFSCMDPTPTFRPKVGLQDGGAGLSHQQCFTSLQMCLLMTQLERCCCLCLFLFLLLCLALHLAETQKKALT